MFGKSCWNNIFLKKRFQKPQSEYFRISTIVSKSMLSALVSFKVILCFELGLIMENFNKFLLVFSLFSIALLRIN